MLASAPPLPALIACVDSSEDVLLLMRDRMVDAGYRAVTFASPVRYGQQPVVDFVTYLAPAAVVYCVSPPYEASWAEFLALRTEVPETPCLPVTTNKAALERLVGPTEVLEVLATAADLDVLTVAVHALLAALPERQRSSDGRSSDGHTRDGHSRDGQGQRAVAGRDGWRDGTASLSLGATVL